MQKLCSHRDRSEPVVTGLAAPALGGSDSDNRNNGRRRV